MRLKWKTFTIWMVVSYLFYAVAMSGMMALSGHHPVGSWALHWRTQGLLFAYCVVPPFLATMILWALPIRRGSIGILVGLLLGMGGIAVCGWLEMVFFGGFEDNIGIFVTGFVLLIPSCFIGAIAGLFRFREKQSENPRPDFTLGLK